MNGCRNNHYKEISIGFYVAEKQATGQQYQWLRQAYITWDHRPIAGKSGIRPSGQVLNTILKDLTIVMNIMLSHVGRCT